LVALGVLGNSVHGLDFANWRKVFHAIVLPILTYGSPVWFTDIKQKGLVSILQVAQNEACHKISGCFRTTPTDPLHYLLGIPPILYTLRKYRLQYTARLSTLPPTSPLCTAVSDNPLTRWHHTFFPPTNLTCLVESLNPSAPPFLFPLPLYAPPWSHPRYFNLTTVAGSSRSSRALIGLPPPFSYSLFMHTLPVPSPSFASAFLLYSGERLLESSIVVDTDQRSSLFGALVAGLKIFSANPSGSSLRLFLPNKSLLSSLTDLCTKSHLLPLASSFTSLLDSFLNTDFTRRAELRLFKKSWSVVPGKDTLARLLASAQPELVVNPPIPHKHLAFHLWHQDVLLGLAARKPGHHAWIACPPTPSPDPPPFVRGLLSHGNRALFSNGLQLLSRHGFIADYSDRFRPDAGDNTCCPCNYVDLSSPPPSPGFTLRTTLSHILFDCPLYSEQRASTLSHYSSASIFSSEQGGRNLAQFSFLTQATLRPLPPRPDPP
jgi:hypothetical protein